jgi:hypothetical protein
MFKEGRAGQNYKTYQLVGLLLGPLAFAALYLSPTPAGLSAPGWATAALAVWMAIWWTTDALPLSFLEQGQHLPKRLGGHDTRFVLSFLLFGSVTPRFR